MNYILELTKTAQDDIIRHKRNGNKAVLKKIEKIFNELIEHPRIGIGQPKQLKFNLKGLYSRRLDKKHRLIYSIEDAIVTVYVLSAYSHYDEKWFW